MDVEERVDELEECLASVIADSEVHTELHGLVHIPVLYEHVLHALHIIGVVVHLEVESDVGEGCFVYLHVCVESHSRAKLRCSMLR
jgi:hypothetical protein